ncbi:hypothetical protein ACFLZW_00180 [Chloroflexota bacterium]
MPISYNRWLYVYSNPTNHTDPPGLCVDDDLNGECDHFLPYSDPPDIQSYNEKTHPSGVSWNPASDPLLLGAGGIPYGVNQAQFKIKSGWTGLSGPVSVAAIIRSKDTSVTAHEVVETAEKMFGDPNNLNASQLEQLTDGFIHENYYTNWSTSWGYISRWIEGEPYYWIDPAGEKRIVDQLTTWLSSSRLVIAGVMANGSTGRVSPNKGVGHWVVITGISTDWQQDPWNARNWIRI